MPNRAVNYVKSLLLGNLNLSFVGLMIFLSLVINSGFFFLLFAVEMGLVMLSQAKFVQKILHAQAEQRWRLEDEQQEESIISKLNDSYKNDFNRVRQLCRDIERQASETEAGKTSLVMMEGLSEKLTAFRFEYVRMLRAHSLLANRDYMEMKRRVADEIKRFEKTTAAEQSPAVRVTLEQNLKILHQRSNKLQQLNDLVRLLEARLQVVRNSLQLIHDEVYSLTNVAGISEMVDGLLTNLQLSDEFRSYYDDVLNDQIPILNGLDTATGYSLEPEFTPESDTYEPPRRQKSKA
jgi:hypothetical protein